MPKIFEYLGYAIYIYTNDHLPIHIHAEKGEFAIKAEFTYQNGVLSLHYRKVRGMKRLPDHQIAEIEPFLKEYEDQIVDSWSAIHIKRQRVKVVKITKRL